MEDFSTYSARCEGKLEGASDPLRHPKIRFGEELADGSDSVESQRRLFLIWMIQKKGGKLSSSVNKLFSSEEGSPPKASPTLTS